jgi:hypothetical protein
VVTTNPGGTGKPAAISSPRFAALPPARGIACASSALSSTTTSSLAMNGTVDRFDG